MRDPIIPPAPRAVVEILEARGYYVKVRRDHNGRLRYRVNRDAETGGMVLMLRFEAGHYPRMED